jgi:ribonuclease HII
MKYEIQLYADGIKYIAGVDEVGRGPLAGPVYAAAVILDNNKHILGVKDSKKLSARQREYLLGEIKKKCIDFSIGSATVEEIDSLNILNATKLAMKRAIDNLKRQPEHILIDAINIDNVNIKTNSNYKR